MLLVKEGASDVSAGMYNELQWTSAGLVQRGYFVIRDDEIRRNVPDDNPESSAIGCDFAKVDSATAVLASVLTEEDDSWLGEYFVFRGDYAEERRVIWSSSDPTAGIIIDPDREGTGVLRFSNGGGDRSRFEFYRL